jgi:chorismate mutase/prephenate dehydrogenase
MANDPLAELRARIAELDTQLCALLAERMRVAEAIGREKAARNAPISVRDIEDQVLARARAAAPGIGVSTNVMEAIFQAIVMGSVERQHRIGIEQRTRRGGRVLVLGSAGGMGRWFQGWLELAGHAVDGLDPAPHASASSSPAKAPRFARLAEVDTLDAYDTIFVSTPLGTLPDVLREIVARRPRGRVVEISSIKSHLVPALDEAAARGVEVSCLHPMFGPRKPYYGPLTFALACRGDADVERTTIERLLAHPYAKVVAMPFAEHDRRMGWLLGLAHLSGIAFASALTHSGLDPAELEACASTTFARQKATALSVVAEDPALYLDIQHLNPHRAAVFAAAGTALAELQELVERNDRAGFARCLARARAALETPNA